MAQFVAIGKPVGRVEGEAKVSGAARYAADIILPGMLWAKCLRSPLPHARIVRVDTSRAAALPGVQAVIVAADLPDRLWGRWLKDMPVLARDRVRFVGEKVAAVAADDPDTAEDALNLIDVEYEELPAIFDPLQAVQESAIRLHPNMRSYQGLPEPVTEIPNCHSHQVWTKGDVDEGFRQAARVFEHVFTTPTSHHGYIEPNASILHLTDDGPAPYHGKAIGESANVPTAPAIANAIYQAVGVRITELPITAEKLLRALRERDRAE